MKNSIKILVSVTFSAMIIVNALANILPINGQGTGQVSDSYPNLFAPAGFTFAIWGLIYMLLGGYTLYQLGFFQGAQEIKTNVLDKIGLYFSLSSVANSAWIFSWHYNLIPLSMLLMTVILVCLIFISQMINNEQLTLRERVFIGLPFSVYFGWITVATIANATVLLVSLGWNGFGLPDSTWTIIMLSVGMMIGISTMLKNTDIAFGLVLLWAYAGILQKHISMEGFDGQYPGVITTAIICIGLLFIVEMYGIISKRENIKFHLKG